MSKLLYWSPRAVSLLFVAFISLFALDVFGEYTGFLLLVALFMHLIPSLILLLVVMVAWRYELVGVIGFFGFALWYVWFASARDAPWGWYATIALPAAIVGALYLYNWYRRTSAVN